MSALSLHIESTILSLATDSMIHGVIKYMARSVVPGNVGEGGEGAVRMRTRIHTLFS